MRVKFRVLALHSFRTNGKIFESQCKKGSLDAILLDLVEVVYIDAPNIASGRPPKDVAPFFDPPYYEWSNSHRQGEVFVFDEATVNSTHAYVANFMRQYGPFDGILGFSQGAGMAAAFVAAQELGKGLLQGIPPIKFCILFAGFVSSYEPHGMRELPAPLKTPSLHIYGELDFLKQLSEELLECFYNPVVIIHPKGHVIPRLTEYAAQLRQFIEQHGSQPYRASLAPGTICNLFPEYSRSEKTKTVANTGSRQRLPLESVPLARL